MFCLLQFQCSFLLTGLERLRGEWFEKQVVSDVNLVGKFSVMLVKGPKSGNQFAEAFKFENEYPLLRNMDNFSDETHINLVNEHEANTFIKYIYIL